MRLLYGGLDVGSSNCHFTALDGDGAIEASAEIPTSELHITALLSSFKSDEKLKLHLEASELSRWIRSVVTERVPNVEEVVISDPKRIMWITRDPQKGDKVDSLKLADLLRHGTTHPVYYSDNGKMSSFKKCVQNHESLVKERSRSMHKIKAGLRWLGIIIKDDSPFRKSQRERILGEIEDPLQRLDIEDQYVLLDQKGELCKRAEKRMKKFSKNWPIIEKFMEVPGIGLILACRFFAYVQTPWRFSTKRKLWKFFGLGITDRSSDGKPLGFKRLDWNGVPTLKGLSSTAFRIAIGRCEDNSFRRTYYRSLRNTNNAVHARLTVQRKIVTVLWTMWKNNEAYDDSK